MKTLFTLFWAVALVLLSQFNANAQIFFSRDLAVTNIAVSNINGNSVTFTYEIKNVGFFFSMDLKKYYFQTYTSTDNAYDASDLPSGGAILGNNAPVLAPGQSYTGSWTSNSSGNLQQYWYLIYQLKVRPGYSSSETDLSNNTRAVSLYPEFADLSVLNISVAQVDGQSVSYNYTIRNEGASTLYLDRFYFQTYLSSDAILTHDDVASGGAIFTTFPVTIAPWQTYTGSWTSNGNVSLENKPFLIFDVRLINGKVHPQQSSVNDRYVKYLKNSFADLTVTELSVRSVSGNSFTFDYTVGNTGLSTLYLDRFYFQAYVSSDSLLDASDVPAGGSIFTSSPLPIVSGGAYNGSWTSNPGVSLSSHPFLIFDVRLLPGKIHPQKSLVNDRNIAFIGSGWRLPATLFDVQFSSGFLKLESSSAAPATSYMLYSLSGNLVSEGAFEEEQKINTLQLTPGVYVLKLTDGTWTETKKIAIGME